MLGLFSVLYVSHPYVYQKVMAAIMKAVSTPIRRLGVDPFVD